MPRDLTCAVNGWKETAQVLLQSWTRKAWHAHPGYLAGGYRNRWTQQRIVHGDEPIWAHFHATLMGFLCSIFSISRENLKLSCMSSWIVRGHVNAERWALTRNVKSSRSSVLIMFIMLWTKFTKTEVPCGNENKSHNVGELQGTSNWH